MLTGQICSKLIALTCALFLSFCLSISANAGSGITFFPIEDAKYIIRGEGWQQGDSVQLTVAYDNTYLVTPEVTTMGGELLERSRIGAVQGQLQLSIHNEEQSPGFEICIFFRKQGDYPAVINYVTAEISDPSGFRRPLPVGMLENPNLPKSGQAATAENRPSNTLRNGEQ